MWASPYSPINVRREDYTNLVRAALVVAGKEGLHLRRDTVQGPGVAGLTAATGYQYNPAGLRG